MYPGQAPIDFLALKADKSDSEASSHWKMFTSDFRFTGKEFFGLGGFGGREKNRQEKRLPDGTMSVFKKYPWLLGDELLVDELCPWHEFYYSTRPPFFRRYDGPNMHRFVKLQSKDGSQR
jgi:hypothetical protein